MKNELTILTEKFLCRQLTPEELFRLKELLMQTEAEDMLSDFYDKKWELATFSPEKEVEERIWLNLKERIKPGKDDLFYAGKTPLWKKSLRIAASIFIPLFCAVLGYYLSENKLSQIQVYNNITVHVEEGLKANVLLPDGTGLWINSASSITYDGTSKNERIVYLQGEAYFEVYKDNRRSFIVKANDISVKALGTSFYVKAYPDDDYITATLIKGSIEISSPSQSEILSPNEKIFFLKNNKSFSKDMALETDNNIEWVNEQLIFEQERLENITKLLERMYNIRVKFTSEELKNIRFSGTIKNNHLESILQLISFVSPINYSMENETIIIKYN